MQFPLRSALVMPILLLAACGGDADNVADNVADNADLVAGDETGAPVGADDADGGAGGDDGADGGNGAEDDDGTGNDATPPAEPAPPPPGNGTEQPEPAGEVTLSARPVRASAGATMTLTLRNGLRQPIAYNLCTSAIETRAGRPVDTGRTCTLELRTLQPGRSVDYAYKLPDGLADGRYRFLTQVERMRSGRRAGVRSNNFVVR